MAEEKTTMKKIKYRIASSADALNIGRDIGRMEITVPLVVTIDKETRTLADNAVQWPILAAFADQVPWPVNGAMCKLTSEEWKIILTAAYRQEAARVAQGFDGGMVLLGHRTREFKHAEWSDWMAYLEWAAAEKGVKVPMSKAQAERYE